MEQKTTNIARLSTAARPLCVVVFPATRQTVTPGTLWIRIGCFRPYIRGQKTSRAPSARGWFYARVIKGEWPLYPVTTTLPCGRRPSLRNREAASGEAAAITARSALPNSASRSGIVVSASGCCRSDSGSNPARLASHFVASTSQVQKSTEK